MRVVSLALLPGLILAQIGTPPEFQAAGTFQSSPVAGALDGTSHVAAERTQINESLVNLLRTIPDAAAGVKLIDNRLLEEATAHFRKHGPAEGAAVILFLKGETAASAEALCAISDNRVLPLLGEVVGSAPEWAARILARIEALAPTHPASADAEFYWARALLQQAPARVNEAILHFERAAERDQKATRALLELGRIYASRQQPRDAIRAFEEALTRDHSLVMAHYRLASLYRSVGDDEKSRRHFAEYQRLRGSAPAR